MCSDAGYQTDRDLITGEDVEPMNDKDPIVPFGKYAGRRLSQIPESYVRWGADEMSRFRKWKKRFKLEWVRRQKQSATQKEGIYHEAIQER